MVPQRVAVGSDHAGFALSCAVADFLRERSFEVVRLGAIDETPVDYPAICIEVGELVASRRAAWGVVLGGSGQGEAIAANKVLGIRAALCATPRYAQLAREHNDANVLALGGRFLTDAEAIEIVRAWIGSEFLGGRHTRRVDQIADYESSRTSLRHL